VGGHQSKYQDGWIDGKLKKGFVWKQFTIWFIQIDFVLRKKYFNIYQEEKRKEQNGKEEEVRNLKFQIGLVYLKDQRL